MSDTFRIIPPIVRAEGKDVPPEQIQAGFNSLAQQATIALNSVASDPTGPAGGDLGGTYPNPSVVAVHATSGTENGVTHTTCSIDSSPIGQTTPAAGAFTTLTATTPVGVASGGTGQNALSAHNVLLGEGTSSVGFAAPGASGTILSSTGTSVDPSFQTKTALAIASSGANSDITSLAGLTTALSVGQGGTGRQTLTSHGVLLGEGTAAINQTTAGTTGQMLLGVTGADPTFGNNPTVTGGTIDGTPVGGTTPSTGAFTTLTASSGLNSTAVGNTTPSTGAFTTLTASSGLNSTAVGNTTPSTGAFTTLSASSTVSGAGFTARFASPGPIGNTAASTGAFTTLSSTGAYTPSSTNGIVGTTTNDNANAGSIGEYTTNQGGAISLTSATAANVTSVSLTAGDWDVTGVIQFLPAAGTTVSLIQAGVTTTSATQPAFPGSTLLQSSFATGGTEQLMAPVVRFSLSATTTVFMVATCTFGVSTLTATGFIRARRVR